ncbi:unnamed protein product [Rotaria sordida]|uniref:Uncharacterized protein n=1 Tax=Rotaria sordida TaxID=392033 RepID=A0A813X1V0_9BILA|nr:unnamed protein product [Rotaria sordida]CAF1158304.1 unnamed protein product [Rotaria sordida]
MFMSYVSILILIIANIIGEYIHSEDEPKITPKTTERPREPCEEDDCQSPPNLVGPVVGSLCGIVLIALIVILII